ncbi:MAG: TatD family hydrolase [Candidatus Kerfeldbacteria bacterium]|nr:TatD family hydrolase [Candidatus Kerfeldbacteria bacterium]
MVIDTHTHVNFQPFANDAEAVIQRALDQQVQLINVGTQWESSQRSVQLAQQWAHGVWAAVGVHPIHLFSDITEIQTIGETHQRIQTRAEQFDYQRYKQLAQSSSRVVAIGECGLDYLHFERAQLQAHRVELQQQQIATLRQHLALAHELDLAIIIHCRDAAIHTATTTAAFNDLLQLLREYHGQVRGVIHCYTGPVECIEQFLELGWYIGFTGIVTFPQASNVQAAATLVPLDRLLLETDAPYLTPVPHRGQRNEPAYVSYVAEALAKLHGVDYATVAKHTTANAIELFRLS